MLLKVLNSGYATLANQRATGEPIVFTHFAIGDAVSFVFDPDRQEPYGQTVFTSEWPQLTYTTHTDDCVVLRCLVEHDDPQLIIGNVVLYANDEAFCLCHSINKFDKLVTVATSAGCRWMLQIYLRIKDLMNRVSFDDLIEDSADFKRYANEREINFPHGELQDQAIISRHITFNKPIPLLSVQNEWYGHALARRMNDNRFNVISGGAVGDRYRYDPDTEKVMPSYIRVYMQPFRALTKRMGYIDYGVYLTQTFSMEATRVWELSGTEIITDVGDLLLQYKDDFEGATYTTAVSDIEISRRQYPEFSYVSILATDLLLQYSATMAGTTIETNTFELDAYRRVDFILSEFVVWPKPIKLQYAAALRYGSIDLNVSGIYYSWIDPIALEPETFIIDAFDVDIAQKSPVTTNNITITFNNARSLGRKKATETGSYVVTGGSLTIRSEKVLVGSEYNVYFFVADVYRKAELIPIIFENTATDIDIKYDRILQLNRTTYTQTRPSINTDLRFYRALNYSTVGTIPVSIAVKRDRYPSLSGVTVFSIGEDINVTLT